MSCGEYNVIILYCLCCSVNGSVCLSCVLHISQCLVNCLVKQFQYFCVLCWIDHVWYSKYCVCCTCYPSMHINVPSIGCVSVCRKLSLHLRVWELDHMCFPTSCFFLIVHTVWSGNKRKYYKKERWHWITLLLNDRFQFERNHSMGICLTKNIIMHVDQLLDP